MKKIWLTLLFISTISYLSCKKGNSDPKEIYGTWKLIETYQFIGEELNNYVRVEGPAKYLAIDSAGKIEGEALPDALNYKILDGTRMEITSKDSAQPLIYRYKLTSNILELFPPCNSGCAFKFKRQ